jgi:hypothetical protein
MKRILHLSALFITFLSFAQVPQGISYQAIALNGSGNPVVSSNVGVRLSVLNNSASGTVLYTETQTKTTNPHGLFNLVIGQGTVVSGTFSTINWGTNSKFLKVEMDVAGGTNYTLVGTTQLLSVPYALAADSLVTSAGEGITLVSPNGTPYQVTVNDAGQLSLPTSNSTNNSPSTFYLYGTFNSFEPTTSLLMSTGFGFATYKYGYKYLTSGTQLKIISANNASGVVYGFNGSLELIPNGSAYTIPSNGFYYIRLVQGSAGELFQLQASSIAPTINSNSLGNINPTYNSTTNTFSFIVNGVTTSSSTFRFTIPNPSNTDFGDNLADGTIDENGSFIVFPNTSSTPKNFKVDLILNFNGSGNYTITLLP